MRWGERRGEYAAAIRSMSHDSLNGGHGRDYRGFVPFYDELFRRNNVTARAFDLRDRECGRYILTVNRFARQKGGESPMMIDFPASRHHMRWLKMRNDNLAGDVKARGGDFRDHLREFAVVGWRNKLSEDHGDSGERIVTLNKYRLCKQCIKTPTPPERCHGEGIKGMAWNTINGPRETPYACGVTNSTANYPLLSMDWRVPGPCCPLALGYLQNVDVDFSLNAAQAVATMGNRIVRESGDVRLAARRAQEVEMRKLDPKAQAAKGFLANRPKLRGQIAKLDTIGALPHFRGGPPEVPRPSGLPYGASKTVEMVGWTWGVYGLVGC